MSLESNSSTPPEDFKTLSTREKLQARSHYMQQVRAFFQARGILEVDTFALCSQTIVDEHIDLMHATGANNKNYYLLSSPESAMKQLLCRGSGDIFQLSHVYRKGESGARHSPAFTMLEWYQVEASFETFLDVNIQLLSLFTEKKSANRAAITTYAEAFKKYGKIEAFQEEKALKKGLEQAGMTYPEANVKQLEHLAWATLVEPKLGSSGFEVITNYPPEDCALAKVEDVDGKSVAKRFEIYLGGVELANGYLELQDAALFLARAKEQNRKREEAGKEPYLIDLQLKKALEEQGLPPCYGIAIGFDRLLMLALKQTQIENVLPLPLY